MRAGRVARALSMPRRESSMTGPGGPLKNCRFYPENQLLLGAGHGLRGFKELGRVLRRATVANLEVQVRAGGAAGRADVGDLAAALQNVAFAYIQFGAVRVAGNQVVAVVDVDHVAILRMEAREDDDARGGGVHRRAVVGEEVDAFVHRPLAGERIDAAAEA